MRRVLLAVPVLLSLAIAACTDAPVRPNPKPDVLSKSTDNPPGPYAANSQRPDLAKLLNKRIRPSFNISSTAGGTDIAALVATLSAGQTTSEAVTVNLPTALPKGDVLFSVDLTGSMG